MIVCVDIGNRKNIYTAISFISVAFFPPHAAYRVCGAICTLGTSRDPRVLCRCRALTLNRSPGASPPRFDPGSSSIGESHEQKKACTLSFSLSLSLLPFHVHVQAFPLSSQPPTPITTRYAPSSTSVRKLSCVWRTKVRSSLRKRRQSNTFCDKGRARDSRRCADYDCADSSFSRPPLLDCLYLSQDLKTQDL